ncbi:MAG: hypothetical protein C0394_01755, partial [Syntrophus sp. (in: bacteria)]|nr:hypothetical protein [Syntrophus sp. (in: bacteria)]
DGNRIADSKKPSVTNRQKAGGLLPAQGVQQDAPEQGEDHEGDDRHTLDMEAFRGKRQKDGAAAVPCIL